ncbi:hypothetical protein DLAC_08813 [Tieghemostelium lacteum]|uniref:Uncharacterized protein n=1 Tax=Tieghemostelium lacteum TaxID=361077 RepID=A0A151Z8D6_TIELA|nr:hypothetical protein DLAC_08813 [Tieghemostelium lacteum]|eukprot:KYQ90212.1 hypothetical protein DLAC_08813 [Tieghemostelium lacteum]
MNNNNNNNIYQQQIQALQQYKDIKHSIQSWITPKVLILSSPSVGKLFQKTNNSSLHEVFAQYVMEKKKANFKIGESSYDLQDFKVNFINSKSLDPQENPNLFKDIGNTVDSLSTDEYCNNFKLRTKQDIPYFQKICPEPTPWFDKYRHNFIRASHYLETETFAHPLACIIAVSSEDQNPIGMLVKMFDPAKPPQIFQQYNIDPNIPKIYILVHPETSHGESDKRLSEMKNTFGPTVSYILRVNTKEDYCGLHFDPSTAHLNPLTLIINDILQKHIPNYIERSMIDLSENIATNRKSFFSKMKVSFRIGNKKNEKEVEQDATQSNQVSIEQSMRKMADQYFLLQDYEQALSNYKSLVKEYNSDKSPNYFASVNEMIGICNFMLNKESESYLELAYNNYQKAGLNHCSVRVAFLHGELLKRKSNYKALSDLYKQTAEKDIDPFCSAVLWEQAGFYLMHSPWLLFRKACMRIVMAGDKYSEAGKRKHALRCYSFSYSVYEGRDWNFIDDHLHLSLVRYSFFQGHTSDAILFVNKLLEKNCQSFQKQNSIIREFLFISKSYTKDNYIGELPIPSILNDSIQVGLNDYSSEASKSIWRDMEDGFKKEAQIISKPQLQGFDLWRKDLFVEAEKERTAVVEELITVEVEIKNPLQIPLQFNRVHLVASFKDTTEGGTQMEESNMSPLDDQALEKMQAGETPFIVEPVDLLLGPSETKKLLFSIQPTRPGLLVIKGLGLCMCGVIWGKREFKLKQKRLNKTKAHRESVMYEPNLSLTFRVTSPMPRLEVQFLEFAQSMFHGELRQAKLLLKNCSNKMGLKNVRIRLTHPSMVCFGTSDQDASLLESLDSSVLLNISLKANEQVTIPFWVRAIQIGRHQLGCLVYYESEAGNSDLKYRLARCQTEFEVKPSIRVATFSQQSSSDLNAYILGIEVDNSMIGESTAFNLAQFSAISKFWKIQPLSYQDQVPNKSIVTIKSNQFTNLFFRICPNLETSPTQQQQQDKLSITNISFDPSLSMFDSSSFPVYNFLELEKLLINYQLSQQQQQQQLQQQNQPHHHTTSGSSLSLSPNSQQNYDHPNHLDLVLFWECNSNSGSSLNLLSGNRIGTLNFPNILFLPTHYSDSALSTPWGSWKSTTSPSGKIITLIDPNLKIQLPLRFQLHSDLDVNHSFQQNPLCIVPLKLQLMNCSFVHQLNLTVECLLPHENVFDHSSTTSQYFWTGSTKTTIELKPQEIVNLPLYVCFNQPGVYNINRFKLSVKLSESSKDIYSTVQHLITIKDT